MEWREIANRNGGRREIRVSGREKGDGEGGRMMDWRIKEKENGRGGEKINWNVRERKVGRRKIGGKEENLWKGVREEKEERVRGGGRR